MIKLSSITTACPSLPSTRVTTLPMYPLQAIWGQVDISTAQPYTHVAHPRGT